MALFFDAGWFDARLAAVGLDRQAASAALGLPLEELVLIIKDQRELASQEVSLLATLLRVPTEEMARRAGVGTPAGVAVPAGPIMAVDARLLDTALERIRMLEARVAQLEAQITNKRDKSFNFGEERLDEVRIK